MNYGHLLALTTDDGIYEHCSGQSPLPEHGYCVDDVARVAVVIARDETAPADVEAVIDLGLHFLAHAQHADGTLTNRLSTSGYWFGDRGLGDHWGRALWAWGTIVGHSSDLDRIELALNAFRHSSVRRSPFLRPMAHAALGAAEYLRRFPGNPDALDLLADTRARLLRNQMRSMPWPEPTLTYANAVLPHALIVAGTHLNEPKTLRHGLTMLEWLVELQTRDDHLSPVSTSGWELGDRLPAFDQQPLEVAHLVVACLAAYEATGNTHWLETARLGGLWFYGLNAVGARMHDPRSGGGFDGLTPNGVNPNCGTESTLAYLSTVNQLRLHREDLKVLS